MAPPTAGCARRRAYLLGTQDTKMLALAFAETVVRDAAARGVQTRLFVGDQHGEWREQVVVGNASGG